MRTARTWAMIALCVAPAVCAMAADDEAKPPDFYLGVGYEWDFEDDESGLSVSFAGAGTETIAPDFGLYDDKLLIGVRYMLLGRRADLERAVYGGPVLFWYDDHIGGGLLVGRHLTREVIVEASYRATGDWEGEADLSLGYGLQWPW